MHTRKSRAYNDRRFGGKLAASYVLAYWKRESLTSIFTLAPYTIGAIFGTVQARLPFRLSLTR